MMFLRYAFFLWAALVAVSNSAFASGGPRWIVTSSGETVLLTEKNFRALNRARKGPKPPKTLFADLHENLAPPLPPRENGGRQMGFSQSLTESFNVSEVPKQAEWQRLWQISPEVYERWGAYLDLKLTRELNLLAASIWDSLLECSSRPVSEAILNGQSPCPTETENGVRVYSGFLDLARQLKIFIESSNISDAPEEWTQRFGTQGLPPFHPLFVQIVLEGLAQTKIFPTLDNPEAGIDISDGAFNARRNPHFEREARTAHNAIRFLLLLPNRSCSEWGLWPLGARSVIRSAEYGGSVLFHSREAFFRGEFRRSALDLVESILKTCGSGEMGVNGFYLEKATAVTAHFRWLGSRHKSAIPTN